MKQILKKTSLLSLLVIQGLLPACSAGAKDDISLRKTTPQIRVKAALSQSKILQGSDGLVYLQVDLETPEKAQKGVDTQRKPTDFVVVLDRSGSMGAAQKMNYAHLALQSLVQRLSPQDRFGLVSFDDRVEVSHPLSYVTPADKGYLQQKIFSITPRGNTNISGGLSSAIQMLRENHAPFRSERILLISDGLANQGITDPQALANMVSQANGQGGIYENNSIFALSTIGVGLDFNEYLLSNLADRGQGSYYYLQNPNGMQAILAEEFRGASQIYASNLQLQLDLPPDISLVDASGYPIQRQGNHYSIQPGHLYAKQKKILYLTFALPSAYPYPSRPLGNIGLSFNVQGIPYQLSLVASDLYVACLPPTQIREARDSVNPKVYEEAWSKNNYGKALQESAKKISSGDASGAAQVMTEYKAKAAAANAVAPSPALERQMNEADRAKGEMEKAAQSPAGSDNYKSLGKTYHYQGIQQQR